MLHHIEDHDPSVYHLYIEKKIVAVIVIGSMMYFRSGVIIINGKNTPAMYNTVNKSFNQMFFEETAHTRCLCFENSIILFIPKTGIIKMFNAAK